MNSRLNTIGKEIRKLEWDLQFIKDEDILSIRKKKLDQYKSELDVLKGAIDGKR